MQTAEHKNIKPRSLASIKKNSTFTSSIWSDNRGSSRMKTWSEQAPPPADQQALRLCKQNINKSQRSSTYTHILWIKTSAEYFTVSKPNTWKDFIIMEFNKITFYSQIRETQSVRKPKTLNLGTLGNLLMDVTEFEDPKSTGIFWSVQQLQQVSQQRKLTSK